MFKCLRWMNSSSLANCKKRVKQFKDLCANQSANVEKTSFLKEFFYNWDKKEIILKENASKQEIKSYWIPSKLRKWPTKPTKGVRYPKILNENEKEVEIFFELNSEADSENDHENDEKL